MLPSIDPERRVDFLMRAHLARLGYDTRPPQGLDEAMTAVGDFFSRADVFQSRLIPHAQIRHYGVLDAIQAFIHFYESALPSTTMPGRHLATYGRDLCFVLGGRAGTGILDDALRLAVPAPTLPVSQELEEPPWTLDPQPHDAITATLPGPTYAQLRHDGQGGETTTLMRQWASGQLDFAGIGFQLDTRAGRMSNELRALLGGHHAYVLWKPFFSPLAITHAYAPPPRSVTWLLELGLHTGGAFHVEVVFDGELARVTLETREAVMGQARAATFPQRRGSMERAEAFRPSMA
ncbi:hypothetical protein JCM10450v2_004074 [Rhodotorula kratochvilovae]